MYSTNWNYMNHVETHRAYFNMQMQEGNTPSAAPF